MIYSLSDVQKFQSKNFMSSDIIFDSDDSDKFELVEIPIENIKLNNKKINFGPLTDEDKYIVKKLKILYKKGNVNPFVVDENNNIMDGIHRYQTEKILKHKLVRVFRRIKK
jgi:hypothetical protein